MEGRLPYIVISRSTSWLGMATEMESVEEAVKPRNRGAGAIGSDAVTVTSRGRTEIERRRRSTFVCVYEWQEVHAYRFVAFILTQLAFLDFKDMRDSSTIANERDK